MSTPVETAGEALVESRYGRNLGLADRPGVARDVFASLAQHRDDIARVLYEVEDADRGAWDEGDTDPDWLEDAYERADAVLAYLTGGAR